MNMKKICTLLMILSLTACTFDKAPPDNISNSQTEISNDIPMVEATIETIEKYSSELDKIDPLEEKTDIIFSGIDYSSLPTQDTEFDSIRLFQDPIKSEGSDNFIHIELGLITEGKYKDYIFGSSRFYAPFQEPKTDFYLREQNKKTLYYLSDSPWSQEKNDRPTISDFSIPSLQFQEETILAQGNSISTNGILYYNQNTLDKIRNYEKIQAEEPSYILYKDGWAFYRIIQDNFYLLYQYTPVDEELNTTIKSMSSFEQENYFTYLLMQRYEDGPITTVDTGVLNLFHDQGVTQGQSNILNFDNLEQIHNGPDLDLYIIKEFIDERNDYESQLLQEIFEQHTYEFQHLQELQGEEITSISKEEFFSLKPILIQTDNMGEFSVYIRSDIIQPFEI